MSDTVRLEEEQLRAVRYCVAEVIRNRLLKGTPVPVWMHALHHHLSSVNGTEYEVPQEESNQEIDTAEAARILGCSTRWVRRIATDLDGRNIAGRWIFDRRNVIEYAAMKRSAA